LLLLIRFLRNWLSDDQTITSADERILADTEYEPAIVHDAQDQLGPLVPDGAELFADRLRIGLDFGQDRQDGRRYRAR
jgi:hypothetical protein